MRVDSLDPIPTRAPETVVEPHPYYVSPGPDNKDGQPTWKVSMWRFRCLDCGQTGIGWKNQTSAIAQADDHYKARHAM